MSVRVYTSFDELPEAYQEFFTDVGRDKFFSSERWFRNLAETTIEAAAQVRLYAVEDDDHRRTPLVLLITRTPAGQNGSVFSRRWIGRRTLAGMTNFQSVQFAPLVSPSVDDASAALRQLVTFLWAERPRWSLIDINLFESQSPLFRLLKDQFSDAGMVVRSYFYAVNRYEVTETMSYRDYLKNRPDRVRRDAIRRLKRLEEGHKVRLEIVLNGEELESAIARFEQVYSASWKEPEDFPRFNAGLIRAGAAAGTLRLGFLYVDDEAAAAQLWIVSGGKATIYKPAYDERFKKYSAASILTAYLMEYVIDVDKAREVDFGLFDETYKKAWLEQRREVQGLAAFNPQTVWGLVALMRYDIGKVGRGLLNLAKPILKPGYAIFKDRMTGMIAKTRGI